MPLKVKMVNGLRSNKYNLYTDALFDEEDPATPALNCMDLARPTPIKVPFAVPLDDVNVS